MLCELSIRNFAIIDDLRIRFNNGLTVLSGETGAGKSIIINGVNLLLGSRASARLIRTGADNAELEALFQVAAASRTADAMTECGYDPGEGLVIRRVISTSDRHRIYINGRLATMQNLKTITRNLASISGQHAHQGLLSEEQHLLILDRFADLVPLRTELRHCFQEIIPLIEQLKKLRRDQKHRAEQKALLEFQIDEIESSALEPGEDRQLEQEKARFKNTEQLYQTVYHCLETLYDAQGAVVEQLMGVSRDLEKAAGIDGDLTAPVENLNDTTYRLEDLAATLREYLTKIRVDPQGLEAVEARLDAVNKLKRKYGGSLETLFATRADLIQKRSSLETLDDKIEEIEIRLQQLHTLLAKLARKLSAARKKAAIGLATNAEKALAELKMADTRFDIAVQPVPAVNGVDPYLTTQSKAISETGCDRVRFLIAPNVGEKLKPLADIASGGELSRVVLALKAILAHTDSVQSIVFDEVDAGIGGGVAEVVGRKMARLARHHQVLCITHLPQIAKFGDQHFKITKQVAGGRTQTIIHELSTDARVRELARMLGGEKITPATLAHAHEMMEKR